MLVLVALALAIAPATAGASLKVSAWTGGERLAVARDGSAQITWREGGRTRTAVVRGDHISYRATIGRRHVGRHVAPDVAYGLDEVVLPTARITRCSASAASASSGGSARPELRFARWRGEQPRLSLTGEWAYNGRFPRICGTATYHGRAFFGGATRSADGRSTHSAATSTSTCCAARAGSASWACSRARGASRS